VEALAPFIMVGWFLAFGIPVSLAVLAFSAYYRLKGMERAAWAIVSQLQAMRREERPELALPLANAAQSDAPTYRHVVNSMFGR
jgi:hypothetical protein